MNELECLAKLEELHDIIMRNRWQHLYEKADVPIPAKIQKIINENTKLQQDKNDLTHDLNRLRSLIKVSARNLAEQIGFQLQREK